MPIIRQRSPPGRAEALGSERSGGARGTWSPHLETTPTPIPKTICRVLAWPAVSGSPCNQGVPWISAGPGCRSMGHPWAGRLASSDRLEAMPGPVAEEVSPGSSRRVREASLPRAAPSGSGNKTTRLRSPRRDWNRALQSNCSNPARARLWTPFEVRRSPARNGGFGVRRSPRGPRSPPIRSFVFHVRFRMRPDAGCDRAHR